jgi:hypothetical protein
MCGEVCTVGRCQTFNMSSAMEASTAARRVEETCGPAAGPCRESSRNRALRETCWCREGVKAASSLRAELRFPRPTVRYKSKRSPSMTSLQSQRSSALAFMFKFLCERILSDAHYAAPRLMYYVVNRGSYRFRSWARTRHPPQQSCAFQLFRRIPSPQTPQVPGDSGPSFWASMLSKSQTLSAPTMLG